MYYIVRVHVCVLQKNVHATKLMTHMCDQVVPSISLIQTVTTGGEGDTPTVTTGPLDVLKLVAEMSVFAGDMKDVDVRLGHLYTILLVSSLYTVHRKIFSYILYWITYLNRL
jgi:hypothetical protein